MVFATRPWLSPPMHKPKSHVDVGFVHDVCCGIGGFATALDFLHSACGLPGHVLSGVDVCPLAMSAFQLNHAAHPVPGDISCSETVFQMHQKQNEVGCQPLLVGGFPCQPLSRQGFQRRQLDVRSKVLPAVLRAAFWLQVSGVCLECVPEAANDPGTQSALAEFARLMDFTIYQKILHLHDVWPSRRSRWFAVLIPEIPDFHLLDLPKLSPAPSVGDLIPPNMWPVWGNQDEKQLEWTSMENQVYKDHAYGNVDRRVDLSQPLPTALHSWGSALYGCPCKCRSQGFHPQTLLTKGLRGVEIVSRLWPHVSRHIHPRELQFLLGFPPLQHILPDCRAQLCLFGNSVSPVQVVWILSQVYDSLQLLTTTAPRACLCEYLCAIVLHRDITWPSPQPGIGQAILEFPEGQLPITFNTRETIGALIRAEATLHFASEGIRVSCQGLDLPDWAYIQERTYQIVIGNAASDQSIHPVPIFLDHLGIRKLYVVPASFTIHMFLAWVRISVYQSVTDEQQICLNPDTPVQPWRSLAVQLDPEDLAFELSLRLDGFGPVQVFDPAGIRFTETWGGTGLWHVDQLVKSNLLVSWAGASFCPLTVWLPSFAAAVVELWPSVAEDHLRAWLSVSDTSLYAIVLEPWGWNLIKCQATSNEIIISFFEPESQVSASASYLAFRAFAASGRSSSAEVYVMRGGEFGTPGTLERIFALLDFELDLPSHVAVALKSRRNLDFLDSRQAWDTSCSTTLPYSVLSTQLPMPVAHTGQHDAGIGLTAKFLLDFSKAWIISRPLDFGADQIKVVSIGADSSIELVCNSKPFLAPNAPAFLFVLVNRHWTFLRCHCSQDSLQITQFDGLAFTTIQQLTPLVEHLKSAWQVTRVVVTSTWEIPQSRINTCGTVALAHFGLSLGLLTWDQAVQFENLHDSLAICGSMTNIHGLSGFGAEENAIIKSLEQILPAHGVPHEEVKSRAQAAIKVFGVPAVTRALGAKNTWMALKQLGNSRPKPFMWVTHEELQIHIRDRSQGQFGVESDSKKGRRSKEPKKTVQSLQLDPNSLTLPNGVFITNDNTPVAQINISEVQKNARGIAFGSYQDVQPFLAEGKSISPDGLSVLVVGPVPGDAPFGLPTHAMRVPAVYKGTNEPILLDVMTVQLGDLAIYRKVNQAAPELAVFPTVVFRVHIFKDLWILSHEWTDLVAHPVRSLVQVLPLLKLCRNPDCDSLCGAYHPSIEETGVESGLIDVWAFRWIKGDGAKSNPAAAEVMTVYVRVPESSFACLHSASGTDRIFFEPRCQETPGPDPTFSVVWVPQASMQDIMHKVKTVDHCLAACRIGTKYGVRCLTKHHEAVHCTLKPQVPYVNCEVKEIYRLEPLPVGTQRQSLSETLQQINWRAKPLQPCKGSQGRAWTVGAETPPPCPFIQAQHGWISIAKVKDQLQQPPAQHLIATAKTRQHIGTTKPVPQPGPASDPWANGRDPWGGYHAVSTKAPAPPSQHVQQNSMTLSNASATMSSPPLHRNCIRPMPIAGLTMWNSRSNP